MVPEQQSKLDRELIELLNELRVALPGVQVLFAFLLAVPFSQGFSQVTSTQRAALFVALVCTTISTILLIAPSAHHRLQFRQRDKERLILTSNFLAAFGTFFLALAMTSVVFLIVDVIYGGPLSVVMTVVLGLGFLVVWYAIPVARNLNKSE